MAVIGSISAQNKTAYLDLYQRGGAQHLRTTLLFNQKKIYLKRKNMGEVLNMLAELGWEADWEAGKTNYLGRITLLRLFYRHKFHIILKKEYQTGENPFDGINYTLMQEKNTIQKGPVIHIQEDATAIRDSEFYKRRELKEVHIHENIIRIGIRAFGYCTNLTAIYCEPLTPPKVGLMAFQGVSKYAKIYVPKASVDTYKTANGWKKYADQIVGYDF